MANTVSVYVRESSTRSYIPAKAIHYPLGTTFVIRFKQGGKRIWQNLPGVRTFGEAKHAALTKQIELLTGVPAAPPKPVPTVVVKPTPPIPVVAPTDTLGVAIDKYLQDALDIRRRPQSVH